MTVAEMKRRLSAREYDDWMLYMQLFQPGERGAYLRSGTLVATVRNIVRRASDPVQDHADVYPFLHPLYGAALDEEEAEEEWRADAQTPEQWAAFMEAAFGALATKAVPDGGAV